MYSSGRRRKKGQGWLDGFQRQADGLRPSAEWRVPRASHSRESARLKQHAHKQRNVISRITGSKKRYSYFCLHYYLVLLVGGPSLTVYGHTA